ncbi:hypothetical protein OG21DRAFT_1513631 [Imleria badia]|nr:hypothetical protein OG21DRAFT_1513631 [Imleria badia]
MQLNLPARVMAIVLIIVSQLVVATPVLNDLSTVQTTKLESSNGLESPDSDSYF